MTDTTLAQPTRPLPVALVLAAMLLACFLAIAVLNGYMVIAPIPALPYLGAVLLAAVASLVCMQVRGFGFGMVADAVLAVAIAALTGYGIIQLTTSTRGDHEINEAGYGQIARTLSIRPDAAPLLAAARADGVITNDEHARFDIDLRALDRDKALGRR